MEFTLYSHNERAYKKLVNMLQNSKYATINHATGTGKSFIALKYLVDNNDKKFLYLAPTYEILNQLINRDAKKLGIDSNSLNVDTMIYRNLLKKKVDIKKLYQQYDGFILDEYHRAGSTEVFKKISELKKLIDSSDEDKKFIGLTATPIRYLDNARNMTEELFEGNVASSISIAKAIADDLLPMPMYINSVIAVYEEYIKTKKTVDCLPPCEDKTQLLNELVLLKPKVDPILGIRDLFDEHIKKDGKYIIFCSNLKELNKCLEQSKLWFENFDNVNNYIIHSGYKKEENLNVLNEFNNSNSGLSLLFTINILNEGVHVDDVDGIILNRKTISPIIYFQQIGRTLSADNVSKEVKIFDLVNNFAASDEIKDLFEEVETLLKEKIKLYPEKEKYYQSKLDKLQILDYTKDVFKKLKTIKMKVTKEKIIKSKIDFAITTLSKYYKKTQKIITYFNIVDPILKKSYIALFKYENYVTNDQLSLLQQIDIILPDSLSIPMEERKKQLQGYESLYLKEQAKLKKQNEDLLNFLQVRIPKMDSKDERERFLASIYPDFLVNADSQLKKQLKIIFQNIKITSFEKAVLDIKMTEDEANDLINSIYLFYEENGFLHDYQKKVLLHIIENDELAGCFVIASKILKLVSLKEERNITQNFKRQNLLLERVLSKVNVDKDDYEEDYDFLKEFNKLSPKEKSLVSNKIKRCRHQKYHSLFKNLKNTLDIFAFIKIALKIDDDNMYLYYKLIQEEKELFNILLNYIDFVITNNKRPSKKTFNKEEKRLAEEIADLTKQGYIELDEIDKFIKEDSCILKDEYTKSIIDLNKQDFLCRYMSFVNTHQRRPVDNCIEDEIEKSLALEYEGYLEIFTKSELSAINEKLNRKDILNKTSQTIIQNKRKQLALDYEKSKAKK